MITRKPHHGCFGSRRRGAALDCGSEARPTKEFGNLLREFTDTTCQSFKTYELPREVRERQRRTVLGEQRRAPPAPIAPAVQTVAPLGNEAATEPTAPGQPATTSGQKEKTMNLFVVKLHFLGDYVRQIRIFGTTDSYSTQLGELAHKLLKAFYGLTNKKNAMKQMARRYQRMDVLRTPSEQQEDEQAKLNSRLADPYYISPSRDTPIDLIPFVQTRPLDPAKKGFIPQLQNHLLGRFLLRDFEGDDMDAFTDEDRNTVLFRNGKVFRHATVRINYTTYDMRRGYDTVNPRNHPFVMMASPESEPGAHPFWYACVLGVFHADVKHIGPLSQDVRWQHKEFLWVRWLGVEPGYQGSRKYGRLPKIGFVPETDEDAFGFLDPALVLRGCHLLPAFAEGKGNQLLSTREPTEARQKGASEDWLNYYVGIFVDRDMLTRHLGIGVGHYAQLDARNLEAALEELDAETEEEVACRERAEREWEERMDAEEAARTRQGDAAAVPEGEENEQDELPQESDTDDELSDDDLGYDNL